MKFLGHFQLSQELKIWYVGSTFVCFAGTLFSISIFSDLMKLDDTIVGIISCTSKILASFIFAFARTTTAIYFGKCIVVCDGYKHFVLKSRTSHKYRCQFSVFVTGSTHILHQSLSSTYSNIFCIFFISFSLGDLTSFSSQIAYFCFTILRTPFIFFRKCFVYLLYLYFSYFILL